MISLPDRCLQKLFNHNPRPIRNNSDNVAQVHCFLPPSHAICHSICGLTMLLSASDLICARVNSISIYPYDLHRNPQYDQGKRAGPLSCVLYVHITHQLSSSVHEDDSIWKAVRCLDARPPGVIQYGHDDVWQPRRILGSILDQTLDHTYAAKNQDPLLS